jgi:hypothetical protein
MAVELGRRKAEELIATIHPVLMENLTLGTKGWFRLKSDKYRWLRRNGWVDASARAVEEGDLPMVRGSL